MVFGSHKVLATACHVTHRRFPTAKVSVPDPLPVVRLAIIHARTDLKQAMPQHVSRVHGAPPVHVMNLVDQKKMEGPPLVQAMMVE
jgi:hypothetical protein